MIAKAIPIMVDNYEMSFNWLSYERSDLGGAFI